MVLLVGRSQDTDDEHHKTHDSPAAEERGSSADVVDREEATDGEDVEDELDDKRGKEGVLETSQAKEVGRVAENKRQATERAKGPGKPCNKGSSAARQLEPLRVWTSCGSVTVISPVCSSEQLLHGGRVL